MLQFSGEATVAKHVSFPVTPSTSSQIPEDILKFYKDSGIDNLAREVSDTGIFILRCHAEDSLIVKFLLCKSMFIIYVLWLHF